MRELTIHDLKGYLGHGLEVFVKDENGMFSKDLRAKIIGLSNDEALLSDNYDTFDYDCIKPILLPLSMLTADDSWKQELDKLYPNGIKVFNVYSSGNNDPFDFTLSVTYSMMGDVFTDIIVNRGKVDGTKHSVVEWMHDNHFDTNGLIEAGLTIDKTTI